MEYGSYVKEIDETRRYWRTRIISCPRVLGMHSAWMQSEWNNYWTVYKDIWVRYICWSNWEIARMGQTLRKNFSVVTRHGKTCSKMCWSVLRIGKHKDGATVQSSASLFGRSSIQVLKQEELESVEDCQKFTQKNVLTCLYLAWIGGPDILWSTNKLAQSVTGWTEACDEHLGRLISYIHHTSDYWQHCHVGNTAQHCRLGLCQDSDFAGWSWRFKNQLRQESCVSLEVEHMFWKVACVRNKRQYPTVLPNQKTFRWMLDCEWMDYLL